MRVIGSVSSRGPPPLTFGPLTFGPLTFGPPCPPLGRGCGRRERWRSRERPASRVRGRSPIHWGARHRVASTSEAGLPSRCRSVRTIRVVLVPSTARWSRIQADAGMGPRSSRSRTTRAKPGQRASRSAALSATRRRPPQRTQSRAERSAPAAAARREDQAHPSRPRGHLAALTAASPVALPEVVIRATGPGERGCWLGGPGTDDLAEPARREHAEQAVDPFALHPGGGEDSIGMPIETNYTSLV
jgi:hypothetical protein